MMDVVPNDRVIFTGGDRASNGEHQPGVECSPQQLTDFSALLVVRQVCTSTSTVVRRTWIGMSLLQQPRNNTHDGGVMMRGVDWQATTDDTGKLSHIGLIFKLVLDQLIRK